jgi:hypothetical protein
MRSAPSLAARSVVPVTDAPTLAPAGALKDNANAAGSATDNMFLDELKLIVRSVEGAGPRVMTRPDRLSRRRCSRSRARP